MLIAKYVLIFPEANTMSGKKGHVFLIEVTIFKIYHKGTLCQIKIPM